MKKSTFDEFVARATQTHAGKYTYPEQEWGGYRARVRVICPEHGEFTPLASNHVAKTGCPVCANAEKLVTQDEFLARVRKVHPTLDFSKTVYAGMACDVEFSCPEHGAVRTNASNLQSGRSGCPLCGDERRGKALRLDMGEWVKRARETHGGRYEYLSIRWNRQAVLQIKCSEHGLFNQSARAHANGDHCPKCALESRATTPGRSAEEYIALASEAHGDDYEYPDDQPLPKMRVICPTHGEFFQLAKDHVKGHGCRKCASAGVSRSQEDLEAFCRSLGLDVVANHKFAGRKELDIFFPDLSLAVEYQGIYWHSMAVADRLNIARKHRLAKDNGIRVISVFEDEWLYSRGSVEAMIRHATGSAPRVFARNCVIDSSPDPDEVKDFLETYHLQGMLRDLGYYVALRHKGEIVLVMCLTRLNSVRGSKPDSSVLELRRMAASCCVVGGASRAFSHLVRSLPNLRRVVSYSDDRCFTGGVYKQLGFQQVSKVRPDYSYAGRGRSRLNKANFTRERLAKLPGFDPSLSEAQNTSAMGLHRIYDCGKTKWEWQRVDVLPNVV